MKPITSADYRRTTLRRAVAVAVLAAVLALVLGLMGPATTLASDGDIRPVETFSLN